MNEFEPPRGPVSEMDPAVHELLMRRFHVLKHYVDAHAPEVQASLVRVTALEAFARILIVGALWFFFVIPRVSAPVVFVSVLLLYFGIEGVYGLAVHRRTWEFRETEHEW